MKPRMIMRTADFIEAIKDQREALGMTHADVDHAVGWQDAYCSKVEGGDRKWGKRPLNMTHNASDLLQVLGLTLVLMPSEDAGALCDGVTSRKITQIGRKGSIPKKQEIVTCTIRRRTR